MTAISVSRLALFYPMPKGYCLVCIRGPSLGHSCFHYILLCTLGTVIQNHPGIHFHFYADDMSLSVHLIQKHVTKAFDRLKTA